MNVRVFIVLYWSDNERKRVMYSDLYKKTMFQILMVSRG